jgi:hypothetical protein
MATKRILTSVFFIAGVTLALLEIGCSIESVPADRRTLASRWCWKVFGFIT